MLRIFSKSTLITLACTDSLQLSLRAERDCHSNVAAFWLKTHLNIPYFKMTPTLSLSSGAADFVPKPNPFYRI